MKPRKVTKEMLQRYAMYLDFLDTQKYNNWSVAKMARYVGRNAPIVHTDMLEIGVYNEMRNRLDATKQAVYEFLKENEHLEDTVYLVLREQRPHYAKVFASSVIANEHVKKMNEIHHGYFIVETKRRYV